MSRSHLPRHLPWPVVWLLAIVITLAPLFFAGLARADYRLTAGDTVEVSIYGAPDLRRRTALNVDGQIAFPLVGSVELAGLSVSEARDKLRDLLARNMANPDVIVEIVEYRPVYVGGDVANPGAYPFQPGMTVRHAIAVAGGLDVLRIKLNSNPLMEAADLSNEFQTLRMDLVGQQARVKRLRTELEGKGEIDFGKLAKVPIPASLYADITDLEMRHLEARSSGAAKEKASIARARNHVIAQLAELEQEQKVEEEGVRQQTEDAAKVKGYYDRGSASLIRVLEEQRSLLLTQSRLLSTRASVMSAKRAIEELGRQHDKTDEALRLETLKELQEVALAVEKIRVRMQTVAEKFAYTGATSNAMSSKRDAFQAVIHRKGAEQQARIAADEDTELAPGDVLEITIPMPELSTEVRSR